MQQINLENFINCFSKNVYNKIVKETSIPYNYILSYSDYKQLLENLYNELSSGRYKPDVPRNILQIPKSKYVARNIPLLEIKDESLYYFLTKYIEDNIAENRTPNTFGGWRLGNPLKKEEEMDISLIQYVYGSYNPSAWSSNWKQFMQIASSFAFSEDFQYAIKLDIANFYDCINLNILLSKLQQKIDKDKIWILDYLFYFLKHWNNAIDNYKERTIGLPQNEFGDQSRLLANFYLQDYDAAMFQICSKYNAEYVRYADDQIIFLRDKAYQEILYIANLELNKIGLNLNVSKTELFTIEQFKKYNLYEEHKLLDDLLFDESFNSFNKIYKKDAEKIRTDTYIKRILSSNIGLNKFTKSNSNKILKIVFESDFLIFCNARDLNNLYKNLSEYRKTKFKKLLISKSLDIEFNGYFYTLLSFFTKIKDAKNANLISKTIKEKFSN